MHQLIRLILTSGLALCVASGCVATTPPPTALPSQSATNAAVEFRVEPLIDLIFLARSIDPRDDDEIAAASPELAAAAEAAAALDRALGNPLAWGLLADIFTSAGSAAANLESCAALPEEIETSGGKFRFRDEAIAFASAVAAAEPAFLSDLWPERKKRIERALETIHAAFDSASEPWMTFVMKHLNMTDPQETIPVYLVGDGPWPGAVTYRARAGGGTCFVALTCAEGSQLVETIIHETIHALDSSTSDEPTALVQLREGLKNAGIAPDDPLMRNLPHLLIFVHAAETTRRCIDANHIDYGEAGGVYARLDRNTPAVQAAWRLWLDGHIDMASAVERLVAARPSPPH